MSREETIQNLESSRNAKRQREIVEILVEEGIFNPRQAERIMRLDSNSNQIESQGRGTEPKGISKAILHGKKLLKASVEASVSKIAVVSSSFISLLSYFRLISELSREFFSLSKLSSLWIL